MEGLLHGSIVNSHGLLIDIFTPLANSHALRVTLRFLCFVPPYCKFPVGTFHGAFLFPHNSPNISEPEDNASNSRYDCNQINRPQGHTDTSFTQPWQIYHMIIYHVLPRFCCVRRELYGFTP